jgi:protein-disulfide isomerase
LGGGGDPRELAMKWLRQATARFAPAGLLALIAAAGPAAASDATIAAELMQPGPLPDIVEGAASAPATIVEYASMTCSHCAAFHEQVWPALKAKYVDTGKAKFILREFPLDPLAIAAFMTARCAGPDKRDALIDRLFASQQDWAFHDEPLDRLRRAAGLSPADFLACVKDKALFDGVNAERDSAAARFGLDSTPTFFVDGRKLDGEPTLTAFDAALAAPAK